MWMVLKCLNKKIDITPTGMWATGIITLTHILAFDDALTARFFYPNIKNL